MIRNMIRTAYRIFTMQPADKTDELTGHPAEPEHLYATSDDRVLAGFGLAAIPAGIAFAVIAPTPPLTLAGVLYVFAGISAYGIADQRCWKRKMKQAVSE